jgi:hypothetical protein
LKVIDFPPFRFVALQAIRSKCINAYQLQAKELKKEKLREEKLAKKRLRRQHSRFGAEIAIMLIIKLAHSAALACPHLTFKASNWKKQLRRASESKSAFRLPARRSLKNNKHLSALKPPLPSTRMTFARFYT